MLGTNKTRFPKPSAFKDFYLKRTFSKTPNILQILTRVKTVTEFKRSVPSKRQIRKIERLTRGQAKTRTWFFYRKGCVTATMTKRISSSSTPHWKINFSIDKPYELSLPYPAIRFGVEHEIDAKNAFFDVKRKTHRNLRIHDVGLKMDDEFPFFAGSADGM